MIKRKKTRQIHVGGVAIGSGSPVSVQSMTKTDTRDVAATLAQIRALADAGCEIIRIAVPDMEAARALGPIRESSPIPVIADIHFDHKLALEAISRGVDGLRINPGNIGSHAKVKKVVSAAAARKIPIRIGVNGGSLEKHLLARYGHPTAEALVESAAGHIKILEDLDFTDIKVSLKASDVMRTVEAYKLFAKRFRYPVHIGISEAGPPGSGTVKSAAGLGILLAAGIGDTMRVSLTADPVEEVKVAWDLLKALGLRERGPELVSCPTCGRCEIGLRDIATEVERNLRGMDGHFKVAVMGCVVNGPGEAREADVGIAGGKGVGILFRKGEVVKKVREDELLQTLMSEIEQLEIANRRL
ncbi:MAG: flavodoxin-dependent (E)-4-hydroxy-3-methylbut-2-enyl-diphosphate synthase [Nitrospirae bacterium]|nr:flavodoxin-dependent (E)-4-hydroxy-3-methylbut-2-enyl-diphosphate synthase [Nitrospirota bacterium]